MTNSSQTLNQLLFDKLDINLDEVPVEKLHYYTAVKYFLTVEDEPSSKATNLEKVNRYLESFHHLCEVKDWTRASAIIHVRLNTLTDQELVTQLGIWGYYEEQIRLYSKLYGNLSEREDAIGLKFSGSSYRFLGNYEKAQDCCNKALVLLQTLCDQEQSADVLHELGLMQADLGKNVEALFHYKEALSLFRELKHYTGIASVLNDMARVATNQNDYVKTKELYQKILSLYDTHLSKEKKQPSYAWILYDLGRNLADQGKNIEARKYSRMALKLFRELGFNAGIAWSLYSLSILMLNLNKNTSAYIYCNKALALFEEELKIKTGIACSLHILGRIAFRQKNYTLAKTCYQKKIKIWWESNNLLGIAFALGGFARLAAVQNQPERAARLFGAAENLHQKSLSPLPPADLPEWEDSVATARTQMKEVNFAKAWAIGREIPIEEVIAEALKE